jgi:hypothetical protein
LHEGQQQQRADQGFHGIVSNVMIVPERWPVVAGLLAGQMAMPGLEKRQRLALDDDSIVTQQPRHG